MKWNNRLLNQAFLHVCKFDHVQQCLKRKIDLIDTSETPFSVENNELNSVTSLVLGSHSYIYPQKPINTCFMNKYCANYFTIEASNKWFGINSIITSSFKQRKNDDSHECNNF